MRTKEEKTHQSLVCVTVCVDYSHILAQTLPSNFKFFKTVYVVTSDKDQETKELCSKYSNVEIIETDVFFKQGTFNKSAGLNCALSLLRKNTWCVILDADILIPNNFKFTDITLDKSCIYSVQRNNGNSYWGNKIVEAHFKNNFKNDVDGNTVQIDPRNKFTIGYFQLFNTDSEFYLNNYDETIVDASAADVLFSLQWPANNNILLTHTTLKHLGVPGKNWIGVKNTQNTQTQKTLQEIKQVATEIKSIEAKHRHDDIVYKRLKKVEETVIKKITKTVVFFQYYKGILHHKHELNNALRTLNELHQRKDIYEHLQIQNNYLINQINTLKNLIISNINRERKKTHTVLKNLNSTLKELDFCEKHILNLTDRNI